MLIEAAGGVHGAPITPRRYLNVTIVIVLLYRRSAPGTEVLSLAFRELPQYQEKDLHMADETTYASRRDRRRANRRSALGRNAASAGRASATAVTALGLVLTSGVAAHAAASGPEQDHESSTVQLTAPEPHADHAPEVSGQTQSSQPESTQAPETQQTQSHQQAQPQSTEDQTAADQPSGDFTPASSGSITPASTGSASNGSVISQAYSAMGSPYSWGGTTPAGFDCSGFINWVYEQAGMGDLPRTTYGMEASLPEVSNPEPGDIVLANNSTHGGIYVGNGQVVSATTSNGVTLHGMDESWHQVNAIVSPT